MMCRAPAEQYGQHRLVDAGELADGFDAAGTQLHRRHPADAPHPLDGQGMQEVQLAVERDDEQPVRLRERTRHLREELRARDADADGQPDPLMDRASQPHRDLDGVPAIGSIPRTSRNASSIERPSTSGVMSSKTAYRSLLACVYAAIRGGTTIASGQSLRASRPPIAVRTPQAFAS